MKTPSNLDSNSSITTPGLREESAFPVIPRPLEFAGSSGHGSFERLNVLSMKGFVKGMNLFFSPAMVLFQESPLWDVFGNGLKQETSVNRRDFPLRKKHWA